MDKAREAFHELLLHEADATLELSHSDICATLRDELNDMFPGEYPYLCDVFGDDESGDVVYQCGGDVWKAPYEIGTINGKRTCAIDDDSALNVVPRTVYDEEADDDDHYAGMSTTDSQEAKKLPAYARRMLYAERFISKGERDAAGSGDFAGKGKSFPILKPGDVMAAVRSMGRAGSDNKSTDSLKSSIIRIAKKKGWAKYLPKAWQGDDAKEAAAAVTTDLVLVESASTLEAIVLKEARADYPIKLIAPGKGASAFYPKEVLQRDGAKVFKAGTHVYLNHPTSAEEAARPEGDVKNLAGVTTTAAEWQESGAKGPGLYARMKVFADHGQMVEEKAPHVGMSIRAGGIAESGKTRDGLPILKQLTHAESVDIVTRAGAGGMILTESAAGATQVQEGEMTPDEVKKLVESAVSTAVAEANKPVAELRQRALRGDAREEAQRLLETVTLPAEAKAKVISEALRSVPLTDKGDLDLKKFGESVAELAKTEGAYLAKVTGSGRVFGNGSSAAFSEAKPDKAALKEARKEREAEEEHAVSVYQRLGLSEAGAKVAAKGRVA